MTGMRLGDWIIDAPIGRLLDSSDYLAHRSDDPQQVARIRFFPRQPTRTSQELDRFKAGVSALVKLDHPYLQRYLGGGVHEGVPYAIVELIESPNLEELLKQGKKPIWPDALQLGLYTICALRYAHRRGFLHRDLRPANLIPTPDGRIKLAWLAISKFTNDEGPAYTGDPLSSAAFLSPEQAAGKPQTKRGEIYSFGCLLYTLITGRPPFTGNNIVELIHKHCFVLPERPLHFVPDLPEEIDQLIMKLAIKDPQQRPGSDSALQAELEHIWANLEIRGKLSKRPELPKDELVEDVVEEGEETPGKLSLSLPPPRPPKPLMSRPVVVIPLFLLVVTAFVIGLRLSGTDPDELYDNARPLLESNNPADWEKAWTEYLEPLSNRYPDKYVAEVKAARAKVEPLADVRRATASSKQIRHSCESERLYQLGLRYLQNGDTNAARLIWTRLMAAYEGIASETRGVELARNALTRISEQTIRTPVMASAIRASLDRINKLRLEGKTEEAHAIATALLELYRDIPDPEIMELLKQAN